MMASHPDQLAAELNARRNAFKSFLIARVGSTADVEDKTRLRTAVANRAFATATIAHPADYPLDFWPDDSPTQ